MHRSAVVILVAEVLPRGLLLIFRDVDRVIYQLLNTLVLRGRDGNYRCSEECLQRVYIDHAAILVNFVHHVESNNNGYIHLKKLHSQIQISLDVRRVHDIDDRFRFFLQDEISGDQLLAAVRGHGINAGKVRDQRILMPEDHAVLPVHCDSGEIADVLSRSGELVEKSRLAAVLVAHQGKGQNSALGKGISAPLGMIFPFLAKARMRGLPVLFLLLF